MNKNIGQSARSTDRAALSTDRVALLKYLLVAQQSVDDLTLKIIIGLYFLQIREIYGGFIIIYIKYLLAALTEAPTHRPPIYSQSILSVDRRHKVVIKKDWEQTNNQIITKTN